MKTVEDNFKPDEKKDQGIPVRSMYSVGGARQPDNTDGRVVWKPLKRFEPLYKEKKE
jgi:hypothetical protein